MVFRSMLLRTEGLLFVTLVACVARAGALEMPDRGTEALGRGGAFVANADDRRRLQRAGLAQ